MGVFTIFGGFVGASVVVLTNGLRRYPLFFEPWFHFIGFGTGALIAATLLKAKEEHLVVKRKTLTQQYQRFQEMENSTQPEERLLSLRAEAAPPSTDGEETSGFDTDEQTEE
eukprot:TRINITY_DN7559_c0_g1_i1.p1 TRINITY_DN7559_c0_g1~~TRINITY_DN7559_c0_g1_i1.p1  ORF type:complete len:112 (-),score=19.66 TRINITY_DN7559_c0_g1_i1:89-424(-)